MTQHIPGSLQTRNDKFYINPDDQSEELTQHIEKFKKGLSSRTIRWGVLFAATVIVSISSLVLASKFNNAKIIPIAIPIGIFALPALGFLSVIKMSSSHKSNSKARERIARIMYAMDKTPAITVPKETKLKSLALQIKKAGYSPKELKVLKLRLPQEAFDYTTQKEISLIKFKKVK